MEHLEYSGIPIMIRVKKERNKQTNKQDLENEFHGFFHASTFLVDFFFALRIYYHSEGFKEYRESFKELLVPEPFRQLESCGCEF